MGDRNACVAPAASSLGGIWKIAAKKHGSGEHPETELSEAQRKLMLRNIRKWKVWVGVLLVSLPVGITSGVEQRAWLPTLAGIGLSLSLMFAAIVEIRRLQRRLVSPPRCGAELQVSAGHDANNTD